jgi:hypothetical protein
MGMEDDMDTPDGVDLDGDVDMDRAGEDEEDDDGEDEKVEEKVDEDEDENKDEDENNGKELWTIGQGEMVNTSANDPDTMIDDQPTVLPDHGQKMCEYTPWLQTPAPDTRPHTPEPRPRPQPLDPHTLSWLEFLGLLTSEKPRTVASTLREADTAGNTSDHYVEQQLLDESVGGESLPDCPVPDVPVPDVRLPDVPLSDAPLTDVPIPDVPLPDVPLTDVPLPNVPLPEARLHGAGGEERTSERVT